MMFPQASESSKAVYLAVPLLAAEEKSVDELRYSNEKTAVSSSSLSSCCPPSSILHFLCGSNMGLTCYYAVHALVLPSLPHIANPLADSAFSALIWSAITTIVAYTVWFGFILVFRACRSLVYDNDNEETAINEALYWEAMEYYYALGVFLGFSAACIISLALAGVPSVFLLAVIFSAFLWTRIMAWMGRLELQNARTKTVLPIVMV